MKCIRCGCENHADSRFCSKCGMNLMPAGGQVPAGRGLTGKEKAVIAGIAGLAVLLIVVFGVKSVRSEQRPPEVKRPGTEAVTAGSGEYSFPAGGFLSSSEEAGRPEENGESRSGSEEKIGKRKQTSDDKDYVGRLRSKKDVEKAAKQIAEGSCPQKLFFVASDEKQIKKTVTDENLAAFAKANGLKKKNGTEDPVYIDRSSGSCAVGRSKKAGYYFMVSGKSAEEAEKFMRECGSMFFSGDAKQKYNEAVRALEKEPASDRYEMAAEFVFGNKWLVEMDVSAASADGTSRSYAIAINDVSEK